MTSGRRAFIDPVKCQRCENCFPQKECGANAIMNEDDDFFVTPFCAGCRICINMCPYRAIEMF